VLTKELGGIAYLRVVVLARKTSLARLNQEKKARRNWNK